MIHVLLGYCDTTLTRIENFFCFRFIDMSFKVFGEYIEMKSSCIGLLDLVKS